MRTNSKVLPLHKTKSASTISSLNSHIIQAAQLRAARGLLDWSRDDCAEMTGLSPETIRNIEHGTYVPQQQTCSSIIQTFAANGVQFLNMVNFRLHTESGDGLDMIVNVAGVVLTNLKEPVAS